MKLAASDGEVLWDDFYGGASQLNDTAWDIVVGPDDDPVITGIITAEGGQAHFYTAKLANADGLHVWDWEELGAVDNIDARSGWLAVLDGGDIAMVSRTWSAEQSFDVVVHRYGGADGWPLYLESYNSDGNGADEPHDLILAPNGDLLICGGTGGDYLVLRVDPEDGLPIWDATYAGPPDWWDIATCLAVGPDGEILASGYSDGDGTGWDVATVAFDPADGGYLWDVRWTSAVAWGSDEARDIAVSARGDIYVVGYTYGGEGNADMLALRYEGGSATAAPLGMPAIARLTGAWPNPFNPRVTLSFALPQTGAARLAVHDIAGREVAVLHEGVLPAGEHEASWNGRDAYGRPVAGGVYFVRLTAAGVSESRKIVLAK